jgi:hypothetical protein
VGRGRRALLAIAAVVLVAATGDTIGQAAFIDRSGFGVTGTGEEVYVAGPASSVCTLGMVLADAGVVRGMQLDINPSWVSGAYFIRSRSGTRSTRRRRCRRRTT